MTKRKDQQHSDSAPRNHPTHHSYIRPTTPNGAESRFMEYCKSSGFSYFRYDGLPDAAHPFFGSMVLGPSAGFEWPGFHLAKKIENALPSEVDRQQRTDECPRAVSARRCCCWHSRLQSGEPGCRARCPTLAAERRAMPDRQAQPNMRAVELHERTLTHKQDQSVG
jgi:hypothetical protein